MWKSLVILLCFAVTKIAFAQDTVWIESPRLVTMRETNEKTLNACLEVATVLRSAYFRIQHSAPKKNIADNLVTSLDTIIGNEDAEIIITTHAKKEYLDKLKDYFAALKDQYDDARQSIKLCDYLKSLRQFYIRDHPVTYYYDKLSQTQIDSLYDLYLQQNAPGGEGMYYFDDWLWLKLHNSLPGDENMQPKKEDQRAEVG